MMKPTRSILDPKFRYKSAAQTDIKATFARVRKEMEKAKHWSNVTPLKAIK